MSALKLIFAGTPDFAACALQALLLTPHQVVAVYTQPDRPQGRGQKLMIGPVKALAMANNIPHMQPASLKSSEAVETLKSFNADLMVVVAYGLILPEAILQAMPMGAINIHASLLPKWRGAAPIQRALQANDAITGISIMQLDAGMDTGAVLLKKTLEIQANDTSLTLFNRLADLGAQGLLEVLNNFSSFTPEAQDHAAATYAHKIKKEECVIDWQQSASQISCQIRAFIPWPVATTTVGNAVLRVWEAQVRMRPAHRPPGEIIASDASGILVATGSGTLLLTKIQLPNGKPLAVADMLHSRQKEFAVGVQLGALHEK